MNKLTEIKAVTKAATPGPWISTDDAVRIPKGEWICQLYEETESEGEIEFTNQANNAEFIANAPEYISYLISLLEEKDKALAFYAKEQNYMIDKGEFGEYYPQQVLIDKGERARKALNTSSNNEGDL